MGGRNLLTATICLALVLCAVAAWLVGNPVVLLPGLALLPALAFAVGRRDPERK